MTQTVEQLQAMDEHMQYVVGLLTQIVQSMDQVVEWAHDNQPDTEPHTFIHDLHDVQTMLHGAMDRHNDLVAQIQYAQSQAAQEIPPNPYE